MKLTLDRVKDFHPPDKLRLLIHFNDFEGKNLEKSARIRYAQMKQVGVEFVS